MEVNQIYIQRSRDILKALNLQPTANRLQFLYAWMSGENTTARNNPLATTWNMAAIDPGQKNFNYNVPPVKEYSAWPIGLAATVNTLKNGYYSEILRFLKNDYSISSPTALLKSQLSLWGTGLLPITIYNSWPADFKKKLQSALALPAA